MNGKSWALAARALRPGSNGQGERLNGVVSGRLQWHVGRMADDPDLRFLGFSLWVDRRQFPDAADYWDSNWLVVRARMEAQGARIKCGGAILMTTDIEQFRDELAKILETLKGNASLEPIEPGLKVTLKMQSRGHVQATIEMTPDHLTQHHRFVLDADQSYLPSIIASCDDILTRFPVAKTDVRG